MILNVLGVDKLCFIKQKTEYEMRSRDWSSDVCSSDLLEVCARAARPQPGEQERGCSKGCGVYGERDLDAPRSDDEPRDGRQSDLAGDGSGPHGAVRRDNLVIADDVG